MTWLHSLTDYQVCFNAYSATGGASDAQGYADQCYNNEPTSDTATQVTVTADTNTTGINAVLAEYGAVSGTVTDAVTHLGIANVYVEIGTYSSDGYGNTTTDANGHYTVTRLRAGTDYLSVNRG